MTTTRFAECARTHLATLHAITISLRHTSFCTHRHAVQASIVCVRVSLDKPTHGLRHRCRHRCHGSIRKKYQRKWNYFICYFSFIYFIVQVKSAVDSHPALFSEGPILCAPSVLVSFLQWQRVIVSHRHILLSLLALVLLLLLFIAISKQRIGFHVVQMCIIVWKALYEQGNLQKSLARRDRSFSSVYYYYIIKQKKQRKESKKRMEERNLVDCQLCESV